MMSEERDFYKPRLKVVGSAAGQTEPAIKLFFGAEAATPPDVSDTVVRGVAHQGAITLIYGMPKTGKSFLATDLALAVADPERERWMGHPVKRRGPVLYVACEGHGGYWKRLQATGRRPPRNFVLGCGRPTLIEISDDGRTFAPSSKAVEQAIDAVRARSGYLPLMVVIDTVFRSFGAGNVSDSMHMMAYVEAVTNVAKQGISVVLVHHSTKAGMTPNGSVALMGSSDTIILTERKEDKDANTVTRTWRVEFAKDDAEDPPRQFELQVVDGIVDAEGEEVTSCRIVDLGAGNPEANKPPEKKRGKLGAHAQTLWQIMEDMFAEQASDTLPGQTRIALANIRARLLQIGLDYKPSEMKKHLNSLVSCGYIKIAGETITIAC